MEIAVIGSSMVDLIAYTDEVPKAGETLEANEFQMGCGGKGANQAVAASLLGSDVMMMARVGDDAFADNTIANFQSFGNAKQNSGKFRSTYMFSECIHGFALLYSHIFLFDNVVLAVLTSTIGSLLLYLLLFFL